LLLLFVFGGVALSFALFCLALFVTVSAGPIRAPRFHARGLRPRGLRGDDWRRVAEARDAERRAAGR
jgi:hypothetical protein